MPQPLNRVTSNTGILELINAGKRPLAGGAVAHAAAVYLGLVSTSATVVIDAFRPYAGLNGAFTHKTVNHSVGEYVRDQVHTNSIDSFWALLERGHYGLFHSMSAKRLHRYVNEFASVTTQSKLA
jgi:hypothetical protein